MSYVLNEQCHITTRKIYTLLLIPTMEYYKNITNNKLNIILSIFMTGALIFTPLGVNSNAFAQGGVNSANQGISQAQNSAQNAACVISGVLTGPACNNTSVQGQSNTGSNTAGQTAGGGAGKASAVAASTLQTRA